MIRQAIESDSPSIANLIVSGWQSAYKGLIDDSFLDNMSADTMIDRWGNNIKSQNENNNIYVYEENNKILGVIRFGKPADKNDLTHNAEIHVLYVKPSLKRHGIGSKLFNFAKDYFIKNNTTNMIIWCLNNNTPSISFYEKMGGKIVSSKANVVHNINVEEVGLEYNFYTFRFLKTSELQSALNLVNAVFDEFEAPDYSQDGITTFKNFVSYNNIYAKLNDNSLQIIGCFDNTKIVGMIAIRDFNHICLLFIDKKYHKQGIAKTLFKKCIALCKKNNKNCNSITVNSSPYAVEIYNKLGFHNLDQEQLADGIRFTPMKYEIK